MYCFCFAGGFSYNASVSFLDISGASVSGNLFDLDANNVRYLRELKNAVSLSILYIFITSSNKYFGSYINIF